MGLLTLCLQKPANTGEWLLRGQAMAELRWTRLQLEGYYPGVVGKITELHATYYYYNWGFDISFETQVGKEVSEFLRDYQEGRDGFWVAKLAGEFAGSLAIDGNQTRGEGVRLRWFIVEPKFQGFGIGRTLLQQAIEFCKITGYNRIYLWTFEGLNTARALYEEAGFTLSEEHTIEQWGRSIKEQKFELLLKPPDH
jgi:GNAT superfamily N-acetyltransferase